jgi:hypothetical protein
LCVVVPIHLFVKIFKKLMCHIVIGGCKVGVLHRLLIEYILYLITLKKKKKKKRKKKKESNSGKEKNGVF